MIDEMANLPVSTRRTGIVNRSAIGHALLLGLVMTVPRLAFAQANSPLIDLDCVVQPSAVIDIGSAVPGLLESTHQEPGDTVVAGELMAALESGVERVALAIATVGAQSSTAVELRAVTAAFGARTHQRRAEPGARDAISEQDLDEAETESRIARMQVLQEEEARKLAGLEQARAEAVLARRKVRSPIDGVVTRRYRSVGEHIDNEPVYQVASLDPLHVQVILPLERLGQIHRGMQASVRVLAPGHEQSSRSASVLRIDPVADAASDTFGVELTLDNPDGAIPGGVRCQIDFPGA